MKLKDNPGGLLVMWRCRRAIISWALASSLTMACLLASQLPAAASGHPPGDGSGAAYCSTHPADQLNASYTLPFASATPTQFMNVYPCGPNAGYASGDLFMTSWQCVEFAARYLFNRGYEISKYGYGKDFATDANNKFPQLQLVAEGYGQLPAIGDIISMSGPGTENAGHVAVVSDATPFDTSGRATISVVEENASSSGRNTIAVTGWGTKMAYNGGSALHDYTQFNWVRLGSSDLYFIKTRGVGHVEVHAAAAPQYQTVTHAVTWFNPADANHGTWQMVGQDLFFIKEITTPNGHVEVHSATAASGYNTGIGTATWFSSADAYNGIWQMVGNDLYFVKIRNTPSGHVEVHSATAASGYKTGIHVVTWFNSADAYNGGWQMVGQDLYFIKTRGVGHVEVHAATAPQYQSVTHAVTWFNPADASHGTWQMVGQDLFFIKEITTPDGHVEVHSATAASGYNTGIGTATWFSSADAYNGAWQLASKA